MSIQDWLRDGPVITDGAWGTEFQAAGLQPGECADLWNLEHPERVASVARSYREAGSRVILTNTFRSNRISLAGYGAAGRVAEINRAGVELSRSAGHGLVFGSIGPSGKMLVAGDISSQELEGAFVEQATALAGADAILIETMSDLEEATIALRAAAATGLPVVVSFAFDSGRNRDRTMMGVTPEQAARAMEQAGASAVGANCGSGIEAFAPVCRRMRESTNLPLWMKANAGLPSPGTSGAPTYSATPEDFASQAAGLIEAGASFVGGCCGTTPEFIRALATVVAA